MDAPQMSERFSSPSGDVVFRSGDGVLFKFYLANLNVHSEVLAADGLTCRDVVQVSEKAEAFELLLRFMNREPQPDVTVLPNDTLIALAEAAEKYQVFAAQGIVRECLKSRVETAPLQILNFAVRHGLKALADAAAWKSRRVSVSEAYAILDPAVFGTWVKFYELSCQVRDECAKWGIELVSTGEYDTATGRELFAIGCSHWMEICAVVDWELRGPPSVLDSDPFTSVAPECDNCSRLLRHWKGDMDNKGALDELKEKMMPFSSFVL